MKDQIPKTTAGEWKFFRHIQGKPGTNLVVSAWLWEYAREALTIKPDCLNWLWDWRDRYRDLILKAIAGDKRALRELQETDPGFPVAAWMVSDDFPESSLCSKAVWNRMRNLAAKLPPCGGADEAYQWFVRRRFGRPGTSEFFPLSSPDRYLEEMGVIRRGFLHSDDEILMLPVEVDLTRSNDFLVASFRLMVETLRKEYGEVRPPKTVESRRGKTGEAARVPPQLKSLAAKRLLDSLEGSKGVLKGAIDRARREGIELYAETSNSAWFSAAKKARAIASERVESLDQMNPERIREMLEEMNKRYGENPADSPEGE